MAIGDVDESKMAASHITGKPKNFSPRSETLNDGDVVFAFTDGLWANLKPLRPENKLFFSELTKGPLTQIEARAKANILEKSSSDDDLALFVLKEEEVERPDTSAQPQATRNDGQKRLEVLADEIEMLKRNLDALDSSNVSVNEELLVNVKAIPKISANLNESLNILREEITERDHSDVFREFRQAHRIDCEICFGRIQRSPFCLDGFEAKNRWHAKRCARRFSRYANAAAKARTTANRTLQKNLAGRNRRMFRIFFAKLPPSPKSFYYLP